MPTLTDDVGCVDHRQGRLLHQVTGVDARLRAHDVVRTCFESRDADGLLGWAWRDPSLFVEPIPRENSASLHGTESWDREWARYTTWTGKAAGWEKDPTYPAVVEALLDAGVHPDDKSVFGKDVLLDSHKWRNDPTLLRIALVHGAAPDMPPEFAGEGKRSVLRRVLVNIKAELCRATDLEGGPNRTLTGLFECAHLLLDAGAVLIDTAGPQRMPPKHPFHSGISLVAERWFEGASPWVLKPMQTLVRRLHERGGGLDLLCGTENVPLVVFALRNGNLALALQLVKMGVKVDDEAICRPGCGPMGPAVRSVVDEAAALGPQAKASMLEAIMRRRLAEPVAANDASASQSAARPRRAKGI